MVEEWKNEYEKIRNLKQKNYDNKKMRKKQQQIKPTKTKDRM